jgi:regulator of nucleoside diphosphate kinase
MQQSQNLILSEDDFRKLATLLSNIDPKGTDLLNGELDRAKVVPLEQVPKDVVIMNSEVGFREVSTGKMSVVTLVFPEHSDVKENKISVLAPVGAALVGLRVGQKINWPMPNGKEKELEVVFVKHPIRREVV